MDRKIRTARYTPSSKVRLSRLLENAIGVDAVRVSMTRYFVIADGEVVDMYAATDGEQGHGEPTEYIIEHCGSSNSRIDSDEDWKEFVDDLTTRFDNGDTPTSRS